MNRTDLLFYYKVDNQSFKIYSAFLLIASYHKTLPNSPTPPTTLLSLLTIELF